MTEATEPVEEVKRNAKERQGEVVAAKADKTITVEVQRRVKHKKYSKYQTDRKRYLVHDSYGCAVGDIVRIRETRPMSKRKRWRVSQRLNKDGTPLTENT